MGLLNFFKSKDGTPSQEVTANRDSRGTIRYSFSGGFSSRNDRFKQGQPSPNNLNTYYELYKSDPEVQAALTTRTDAILASGFTTDGGKQNINQLEKLGFDYNFLYQLVLNGLVYEHVFLEVERTNAGKAHAYHVLETPFMTIKHNEHGAVEGYVQQGETGEPVFFPEADIVYIKFNELSSAVWGEVGLKTLDTALSTKIKMEKFIQSLAMNNAWRQYMVSSMKEPEMEEFMVNYLESAYDPEIPMTINVEGKEVGNVGDKIKFETLRNPDDLEKFLGVLNYLRQQILMRLKVPPIMIGLPDSSNRSNSDAQIKAFNIANESFRRKLDIAFDELFKKSGLSIDFSWNPIDERSEKQDIEIAEKLMNMGAKPDMIEKFLRNAGLELPEGDLFMSPDDIVGTVRTNRQVEGLPTKKSEDMFPSRQRKAEGEANQKIGSGEEGTTREDQL